jgi:hypothetical protein
MATKAMSDGLTLRLAKLGKQLLRACRMTNTCIDRLVGDHIGKAGVPQ